mmetsp:Transcript_116314/g.276474  ORF Transcript_116314/g.276474 Transcript_116314/m.276474 type:complete len:365 (-) Transcript_116314:609-1703(-)
MPGRMATTTDAKITMLWLSALRQDMAPDGSPGGASSWIGPRKGWTLERHAVCVEEVLMRQSCPQRKRSVLQSTAQQTRTAPVFYMAAFAMQVMRGRSMPQQTTLTSPALVQQLLAPSIRQVRMLQLAARVITATSESLSPPVLTPFMRVFVWQRPLRAAPPGQIPLLRLPLPPARALPQQADLPLPPPVRSPPAQPPQREPPAPLRPAQPPPLQFHRRGPGRPLHFQPLRAPSLVVHRELQLRLLQLPKQTPSPRSPCRPLRAEPAAPAAPVALQPGPTRPPPPPPLERRPCSPGHRMGFSWFPARKALQPPLLHRKTLMTGMTRMSPRHASLRRRPTMEVPEPGSSSAVQATLPPPLLSSPCS